MSIKVEIDVKTANQYIPIVLLVGIGIGTANWVMYNDFNWIQWILQSLGTSFIIGYSLIFIAANKGLVKILLPSFWRRTSLLILSFFLIGVIASEVEHIFRSLVFHSEAYSPFKIGKMHLFNGILSLVLGFTFSNIIRNEEEKIPKTSMVVDKTNEVPPMQPPSKSENSLTQIPIKQGENILLINTSDILYFEANDNYAFVYNTQLKKYLCDYNLKFLESRLGQDFVRIHRKYLLNTTYIQKIKPHLNGRYIIDLNAAQPVSLQSSKGYVEVIRRIIKLS